MKIYELAKELNLKSVELLDKLRTDYKMSFKNHMQSLSTTEVETIKSFFVKKTVPKKRTAKKTVAKKTVAKKSTIKKPVIKKTIAKKTTIKTVIKKPVAKKAAAKNIVIKKTIAKKTVKSLDVNPVIEKPIMRSGIIRRRVVKEVLATTITDEQSASPSELTQKTSGVTKNLDNKLAAKKIDSVAATVIKTNEAVKKESKKTTLEKETQNKQFRATDFRKREVIFQPKKKRLMAGLSSKKTQITTPKISKRIVKIYDDNISVDNLADQLRVKKIILIKKIKEEKLLETVNNNSSFDYETANIITSYFNFESINMVKNKDKSIESLFFGNLSAEAQHKPPVVTVMGHVNHGKTTLLDFIRKSRVATQEAGGITQHMGAYSVPVKKSFVTFIDTPGHAAFTSMRKRGAQATDIVIIVVAADDGVQPQTIEAINHAKTAKVPIIIAINKVDLPGSNIDQTKKQLMEQELVPEEWGGDTIVCAISALKGDGVTELLEHVLLVAEVNELKANPNRSAQGIVIETRSEKGRGWVMNLLVQDGTLKSGQIILCDNQVGRVRQMTNDIGVTILKAGPGMPVAISGFTNPVQVGETFFVVKNEKIARRIILENKQKAEEQAPELSVEELLFKAHINKIKTLNIVLKTDTEGSMEALKYSIKNLNTKSVEAKIIHSNIGDINESDIILSKTTSATLLCFNVKINSKMQKLIQKEEISLKNYKVIYDLLKDVESIMASLLDPDIQETIGGRAEVLQVFPISKVGVIAGCKVIKGKIMGNHLVRVIRDEKTIHTGKISSLKRFKQLAKEVIEDQECGISLDPYKDLKTGDIIEGFLQKFIKKETLS